MTLHHDIFVGWGGVGLGWDGMGLGWGLGGVGWGWVGLGLGLDLGWDEHPDTASDSQTVGGSLRTAFGRRPKHPATLCGCCTNQVDRIASS